ncbi:MAG: hypothetical protein R2822_31435 [Spirosomataceae bacterium]
MDSGAEDPNYLLFDFLYHVCRCVFQQFGNGTWQMLPGLGFLWVSLFYIILGSGRFGLDFLITQHFFKAEKIAYLLLAMFVWTTIGCVQQTHKQTVEFVLDVSQIKDIQTVGIRGEGKPLSWQTDLMMNPIKKDSLYALKITAETGYQFVEVKFVVNGQFELENKPNRRVVFDQSGYTTYKAIFDIGQD